MEKIILVFLGAMLVNNIVLTKFLGLCPYVGVSKKLSSSFGMGLAVTFVMLMASVVTWLIYTLLLVPLALEYLQILAFIIVIASLVQFVEMVMQKFAPALYKVLGIYLPLITTNCAILGLTFLNVRNEYNLLITIFYALGTGLGFMLALVLMASIRERLELADVPPALRGAPITFIIAGLMALAFFGFCGMM